MGKKSRNHKILHNKEHVRFVLLVLLGFIDYMFFNIKMKIGKEVERKRNKQLKHVFCNLF